MKKLEFWPDYAGALLWTDHGVRVSPGDMPLPRDLVEQAEHWVASYDDSKLPWEPTRDDEWLAEGRRLFVGLRRELLEHGFDLEPNEDFWTPQGGVEEARSGDPGGS